MLKTEESWRSNRLLTDEELCDLNGDLLNLGLPGKSEFYLSGGLPQLFQRVSNDDSELFEDSWLYIPLSLVKSIRQNLLVETSDCGASGISRHAVRSDNHKLYPVLCRGELKAFIVQPLGDPLVLDDETCLAITNRLESVTGVDPSISASIARLFVKSLFRSDQSIDDFLKATTALLVDQRPHSMGGVYCCIDDKYSLRIAIGDIQLSDYFPSKLPEQDARAWIDSMRRGEFFLPADLLPDYPTMLNNAPSFIFVHPVLISDGGDHICVLVHSGDIDLRATQFLKGIASLAAGLHEEQFATTTDVVRLYESLGRFSHMSDGSDEIIEHLFKLLESQLRISRLVYIVPGESGIKIQRSPEGSIQTSEVDDAVLSSHLITAVLQDERSLIYGDKLTDIDSRLPHEYSQQNIRSEYGQIIKRSNHGVGILAVGSSVGGKYLNKYETLLRTVGRFLQTCFYVSDLAAGRGDTVDVSIDEDHDVCSSCLVRIAEGLLHSMLERISVIVGQADVLEAESENGVVMSLSKGLGNIKEASDSLATQIGQLQWLLEPEEHQLNCYMSMKELADVLPLVLGGYSSRVQAMKKISMQLSFATDSKTDRKFNRNDVVGYLLPLLVSLYDEAVCSTDIQISDSQDDSDDRLLTEFDASTIGHLALGDFLRIVYPSFTHDKSGDAVGVMSQGAVRVEYSQTENGRYRIALKFDGKYSAKSDNSVHGMVRHTGVVG